MIKYNAILKEIRGFKKEIHNDTKLFSMSIYSLFICEYSLVFSRNIIILCSIRFHKRLTGINKN